MTVQNVEVSKKLWVNNITALKGKTTRINPSIVYRDQVKIPVVLIKLHKEFLLTCGIFS